MIVMAAQSRLLNPLERLQGPEPGPACVCGSQAGGLPDTGPGSGRAASGESPAPRAAAQSPARWRQSGCRARPDL